MKPLITILKSHGLKMTHIPTLKADAQKPWRLSSQKQPQQKLCGLVQRQHNEDHPDLPEGSTHAVMLVLVGFGQSKPRPSDTLMLHGQAWRVKTILPLFATRFDKVFEVLATSAGGSHGR